MSFDFDSAVLDLRARLDKNPTPEFAQLRKHLAADFTEEIAQALLIRPLYEASERMDEGYLDAYAIRPPSTPSFPETPAGVREVGVVVTWWDRTRSESSPTLEYYINDDYATEVAKGQLAHERHDPIDLSRALDVLLGRL